MSDADQQVDYLAAGRSRNTERAYAQAINDYRFSFGGTLPASPAAVADYLKQRAGKLSVATLNLRLAALSKWHVRLGFADPTKDGLIKELMRGIRRTHNAPPKKASPITIEDLTHLDAYLSSQMQESKNPAEHLRCCRDRALFLLGFWRGFRADELVRLTVENILQETDDVLWIFMPSAKNDPQARGQRFPLYRLNILCPVQALKDWLEESGLRTGPLFRKVDAGGTLGGSGLRSNSIAPLMQRVFERAGLSKRVSTHSMRRGFATWAAEAGWNLSALMTYVGWKSAQNASGYIAPVYDFGGLGALSGASVTQLTDGSRKRLGGTKKDS